MQISSIPVLPKGSLRINLQSIMLLISTACLCVLFSVNKQSAVGESEPAAPVPGSVAGTGPTNLESVQTVNDVTAAALAFYNLLNTSQQSTLQLTYSSTLAKKWSNLPCGTSCRNGIQLGTNLTSAQYNAAMEVVKAALGTDANNGYKEFRQLNLAEAYLHINGGASNYDSTLRWMAFLNKPTTTGPWMLQFGGHHYAANIAFNNGHVIGATPFFMGLEPKTFTYGGVNYDPLGDERDAFRALFATLSGSQLSTAKIASSFSDCVMIPGESNGGSSSFPSVSIGQPVSSLTSDQKNLVLETMKLYVRDMDSTTANHVMAVYSSEIDQTYISYHGNGTSGNASTFLVAQGDYMRISGPNAWIEFSCQGGIVIQGQIHYHTVWRDRSHDYGVNLTGPAIDGSGASSIGEPNTPEPLRIYPNPANSQIVVQLPAIVKEANAYLIHASSGQLMDQVSHINGTSFNYNLSNHPSGTYILKVQSGNKIYSGKISKN